MDLGDKLVIKFFKVIVTINNLFVQWLVAHYCLLLQKKEKVTAHNT